MAIASRKVTAKTPVDVPVVEQIKEPRESTFTALVPENNVNRLLKYLDGYPWTVDYYGQILNTHSIGNHLDDSLGDLSQPYVKINKLIMYVDSDLSSSYNAKDNTTSLVGSAVLPLDITPNVGDTFIANIDSGEDAIFTITRVDEPSYRKNRVYIIDYTMTGITNDHSDLVERLEKRVNEQYYFDSLVGSRRENHLVTGVQYDSGKRLQEFIFDSQGYYFNVFRQDTTGALSIPGHPMSVADNYLTTFITRTVNLRNDTHKNIYDYSDITNTKGRDNLLSALILRQRPITQRFDTQIVFINPMSIRNRSVYSSPWYLNVDYISYPKEVKKGFISNDKKTEDITGAEDIRTGVNYYDYPIPEIGVKGTVNLNGEGFSVIPLLPMLFEDDYYIVSKNFYDYFNDKTLAGKLSFVEVLIYKYVTGETLSREDLVKVIENWQDWSPLHQYYLLPVMWHLIRTTMGIM